jgi:hypothetical protein
MLSSKFIINAVLALAVIGISITGFIIDDLFTVKFNINFIEPQTQLNVNLTIELNFSRNNFVLKLFANSEDIIQLLNDNDPKIAEITIPYDKINDIEFLTNTIIELSTVITDAIIKFGEDKGIIVNPEDKQRVIDFYQDQIIQLISNNKEVLDEVAKGAKIFKIIIMVMLPFYIVTSLYMLFNFKFVMVTILLILIILIFGVAFSLLVFIIPKKIKKLNDNVEFKNGFTAITYMINSYIILTMCIVYVMMKQPIKKAINKRKKNKQRR